LRTSIMDSSTGTTTTWIYVQAWAGFLLGSVAGAVSMQINKAIMTGDCNMQGLTPVMAALLILLPLSGGLISFRISRSIKDMFGTYLAARVGAEFCVFIIALILMHQVYIGFFWNCQV
jgi:hypothetical protein